MLSPVTGWKCTLPNKGWASPTYRNAMIRLLTFIFCLFASTGIYAPVHAQNNSDTLRYVPANIENISDALFKKGILKTSDSAAVEEYIRIHYCGLYEQYQRDDFSWARIREGQTRDLEMRLTALPDGLEIANKLYLSQYDMASGQFGLLSSSALNNVGTIIAFVDASGFLNACDRPFVPRVHPLELSLKLDKPVTLSTIPMNHDAAKVLLADINARKMMEESEKRSVLLVFRVRITGVDPLAVATDPLHRTVMGQLDDIRIYEGPNRKQLLFRKVFENQPVKNGKN